MTITTTQNSPGGGDYLFEDGFDADFNAPAPAPVDADAIKKRAHIANGGEGEETFRCPACRGSGHFVSYAGRVVGNCYKCKGAGKVGKRVMAAAKGKATKAANIAEWQAAHATMLVGLRKAAEWNEFAAKMVAAVAEWGKMTDNQVAAAERMLAKLAANREAKKEARIAAAPVIEISAIEKLFATATDNDVKRPIFRFEGGEISKAPASGRNAGALYVKDGDQYCGKIVGGKFHATFEAPKDMADRLMAVAADPTKAAMAYGRRFGRCGICAHGLVDPVSIRAGVGPICAENFGLDWKREMAREELNEEAAAEAAKEGK